MKSGPIIAMIAMVFVGMWLVLQPTLSRGSYDFEIRVGAYHMQVQQNGDGTFMFVTPGDLADLGPVDKDQLDRIIAERIATWQRRPQIERTLLGFFNITSWVNFGWVAVGLLGQGAFFGRMFVQWVVSEKSGKSQVPEIFWWFSFIGGVCLFMYFVWRVDVVGVLGQSTGVVIYARNLKLIRKQRKREARRVAQDAGLDSDAD